MRVLALVPSVYDTSPGQRFRLEQWEPWLRQGGIEIRYEPFESAELHALLYSSGATLAKLRRIVRDYGRRFRLMTGLGEFDAVYVFRESAILGPAVIERRLRHAGIPYVFDFDDAVFVTYISPSNGYLSFLKCAGKTRTVCRLAAHVIAGNSYLAGYARRYNPNVTVVPTTIDTDRYQPQPQAGGDRALTIGWSGSHSTLQHLFTLKDALAGLSSREKFRLRVIGASSFGIPGVDVEAMAWRAATEVRDLSAIDIGIMPLPDDRWARGKCGLKALQYMALGIPTVCSPVGVNREIIQDGVNGFLAANEQEWMDRLAQLLHSPDLRARVGRAGRETVVEGYSACTQAPRVLRIFSALARDGASAGAGRQRTPHS